MKSYSLLGVLLAAFALTAVFLVGYHVSDRRMLTADLAAVANLQAVSQNATSSGGGGATSTAMLIDVLDELQNREQLLARQIADISSRLEIADLKMIFARPMKRGDSGSDVEKLQELLMKFPDIYATSSITGFFGRLTEEAVMKFQEQEGLKQTAVLDSATREKLLESVSDAAEKDTASKFTPIDLSTVADLQNVGGEQIQNSQSVQNSSSTGGDLADLQSQVSQLALDASSTEANVSSLQDQISQLASEVSSIESNANSASAAATPPPPAPTPTPTPTPVTQPLAVSNVQAVNITKVSSTITWGTNNPSTSEVHYSQSSGVPASQALIASNTVMATNHSLVLNRLNSAATYYYYVVSKDNTGAVASSTNLSFSTLH